MNNIQRKVLSGLIILCAVLTFATCSPDPDPKVPTEVIVITSIPVNILRTRAKLDPEQDHEIFYLGADEDEDTIGQSTFKVYVQLSVGRNAGDGYTAKGELEVAPTADELASGTMTVTITELKDRDGNPWTGTNWANQCVVISPELVDDIFDIDARVGMTGPSTSPTVVFNWNGLMTKEKMNIAGDGIDNYKKLYQGDGDAMDGIITHDGHIGGTKKLAGSEIKAFRQFLNNN